MKKGRMPDVCLTAHIHPGPLGRFALVADLRASPRDPCRKAFISELVYSVLNLLDVAAWKPPAVPGSHRGGDGMG